MLKRSTNNQKSVKLVHKKVIAVVFLLFLLVNIAIVPDAKAVGDVVTTDWKKTMSDIGNWAKDKANWVWENMIKKAGSKALQVAINKALRTIAYDTATWIGSGGKGQKPLFIKEGWSEYMGNIAGNAAGNFIEQIGREWDFNLCEPSGAVKFTIGLGLVQYEKPKAQLVHLLK